MCRQGVVNTRQSGVFAALFTRIFLLQRRRKCLPSSVHQVLVRHVGNVLACFMSAEGRGWWGQQSWASSKKKKKNAPFGTPKQADYGMLLIQTECLSVRSE